MKLLTKLLFVIPLILLSCNDHPKKTEPIKKIPDKFTLAFGSCNNQAMHNPMWPEILKNKPDIFVWGGDIIYCDTYDMKFMSKNYALQKNDSAYQDFIKKVPVIGTWDDHDYGINDGGASYSKKDSVQQIFLDFFDVDPNNPRRSQKGVYFSKKIKINNYSINILLLDTRYFRTDLTKDPTGVKRYVPNKMGDGTFLGKKQWNWLANELKNSKADYNIIISSVQFLSYEHGFESWGNMPHEMNKLENIIADSNAKGVIILSGDRHIAEISVDTLANLPYPLIDITSSGLTHSYTSFSGEKNPYRVGKVISEKNFGILKFDFKNNQVIMEIRGENNKLYETYTQKYGK